MPHTGSPDLEAETDVVDDDGAWAPAPHDPLAEAVGLPQPTPSPVPHPAGPTGATGPTPSYTVPGYTDLVEIARGGDGVVLRARDTSAERDVAIKVVDLAEPEVRARFEREVAITVRLGRAHPHIVTVLATPTTSDGRPCLVMDFHDLGSLHDRLRSQGPLPVADVVTAGTAIADALAYAHAQGVLHRDVKPQNVLVLPTSYVLADFGIARTVDAGRTASLERFSYRHASPQVLDGASPTPGDDVWSLGSTLFTLLDGRAPFAADDPDEDTALAYLRQVRTGNRRRLARSDVPDQLEDLISACLAPDPAARPDGAAAVLRALRAVPTEVRGWDPSAGSAGVALSTPALPRPASRTPGQTDEDATRERPVVTGGTTGSGSERPIAGPTTPLAAATAEPTGEPVTSPARRAAGHGAGRSALSHLGDGAVRRGDDGDPGSLARAPHPAPDVADDAPTGLAPAGEAATAAAADETPAANQGRRPTTWRRAAAFLGGAALVGAAIGVGPVIVDLVRGQGQEQRGDQGGSAGTTDPDGGTTTAGEGGDAETTGTVPTYDGAVPADVAEAQTGNPDLAPTGVAAVDRGTSAEISWNLPQQDDVQLMVVSQVDGQPVHAYDLLPAGSTTFLADGLDPEARICFAVVGLGAVDGVLDRGASASRCLER